MSVGFLRVRFVDDGDGTGELIANAASDGFSGTGRAYFNIDEIEWFAGSIADWSVANEPHSIAGGLEREQLGIAVSTVDSRGYIGVQVRMATRICPRERPGRWQFATVELLTTHAPLARFGRALIREAIPEVKTIRLENRDEILNELPEISRDSDYVIADGPGSDTDTSRLLLLAADFAIVPCKASMLEVRALSKATEVLRQAQAVRHGVPKAVIVLSMVGKNYRLTQDMKDAAAALKLPVASTAMILRQVYADAPGQGVVVSQFGSRAKDARVEMEHLFREILPEAALQKAGTHKLKITSKS